MRASLWGPNCLLNLQWWSAAAMRQQVPTSSAVPPQPAHSAIIISWETPPLLSSVQLFPVSGYNKGMIVSCYQSAFYDNYTPLFTIRRCGDREGPTFLHDSERYVRIIIWQLKWEVANRHYNTSSYEGGPGTRLY